MQVAVAINLPNDFVEMQTPAVIEREMRISYALALFKAARVTLSKAAELAGMTIYDFMKACKDPFRNNPVKFYQRPSVRLCNSIPRESRLFGDGRESSAHR